MKRFRIRKKQYTSILILVFLVHAFAGCSKETSKTEPAVSFENFVNEIYQENVSTDTLSLHYALVHPETYGISMDEVTMGTFSQAEITASIPDLENTIAKLKSYDYETLTANEQLIYDCMLFVLEKNKALYSYEYFSEPLGPRTGLQAQLPILLAEYTFYSTEDIETYLKLLPCTLAYFSDIAEYEKEKSAAGMFMMDAVAEKIIAQCQDFISNPEENLLIEHFNNEIEAFPGLTRDQITLYEEQNREAVLNYVIPAYEHLIQTLTNLLGTGVNTEGLCGFPDGADYFELMAQADTGSSMTISEMQKRLQSAVKSGMIEMSAAQLTDPTISDRFFTATLPDGDPAENLEYLKAAIQTDFPVLEDVDYSVEYIHESLQDYLSPAMYLVPPFDDRNNNCIYINSSPAYAEESLFPTLAHEGYPGHLYQNVYFLSTDPEPIRHLLFSTGYTEGWGTYAEIYSYHLADYDDALADFCQNNHAVILCLYGLTEIGIHSSGWTKSDTVSFWSEYGISDSIAEEIYLDIVAEPGSYLPYCIGYLEIMDLKAEAEKSLGTAFSPLEFHTFLLNLGSAPFDVIHDRMEQWISENL